MYDPQTNPEIFAKLVEARMPFGKHKGRLLIDLPQPYLIWFAQKGFPSGELGMMLNTVYEVKLNGLEHLFKPLILSGKHNHHKIS